MALLATADTYQRYTAIDREAAYQLWRTSSGRSCRDVARRTGVERATVTRWMHDDGWVERANTEDTEDVQSMRHAIGAIVATEVVPSLETARAIRDDSSLDPRVRLDAAKWLAGLAGVAPVSKIEQAVTHQTVKPVLSLDAITGKSPDELMRLESEHRSKRPVQESVRR